MLMRKQTESRIMFGDKAMTQKLFSICGIAAYCPLVWLDYDVWNPRFRSTLSRVSACDPVFSALAVPAWALDEASDSYLKPDLINASYLFSLFGNNFTIVSPTEGDNL